MGTAVCKGLAVVSVLSVLSVVKGNFESALILWTTDFTDFTDGNRSVQRLGGRIRVIRVIRGQKQFSMNPDPVDHGFHGFHGWEPRCAKAWRSYPCYPCYPW